MNKYMRKRAIDELESEYNSNNDLIAGAPRVTWADYTILGLLIDLMEKVEKQEVEIQQLKEKPRKLAAKTEEEWECGMWF